MDVKTTQTVYVYTECKNTLIVCKHTQCNKITVHTHRVYFYTQCIPTQNVLFLNPSSDLVHQVYFYTQYVVLRSVCKKSWFTLFCREIRFVYIYALLGVKFVL